MYNQLMQETGSISTLNALANGAWIHPKLESGYIRNGNELYLPTLDGRWMSFTATHPTQNVELRWESTLPSTLEKRLLYQVSVVENNIYLQLHRILHARVYIVGTETLATDISWSWTTSTEDYMKALFNRVFLDGQSWRT